MHWYRHRPHEAYHADPPSQYVQHLLRLAWCCRMKGFIRQQMCLCHDCYYLTSFKTGFTPFATHLLYDGLTHPVLKCSNCRAFLHHVKPIVACQLCTRLHLNCLEFNPRLIAREVPTLLYVSGTDIANTYGSSNELSLNADL